MPRYRQRPGQIGEYWPSRRNSAWYRTWFDAEARQTRRVSLNTTDFDEACERLKAWYVQSQRPREASPDDIQLATVLLNYYTDHASKKPSAEAARFAIRYWNDFFGDAPVSDLSPARQKEFVDWLAAKEHSSGYIRRTLEVGRAALNRAYKFQELRSVPMVIMEFAGRGPARERRLSMQEMAALLDTADGHLLDFIMVAANTLARPEAVFDLTLFQCDFDQRLVHLNPPGREQTKKRRPVVPMTDTLHDWLKGIPGPHVISYRGRKLGSIKKTLARARNRAGLSDDVIPYTIRHTMATELRRRGVPGWEVAGMLGHKIEGSTEIYAKYAPDYMSQARAAIDAYFVELGPLRSICVTPEVAALR